MAPHSPIDDLRDLRAVFSADAGLSIQERAVMGVLILHRNGQTGRIDPSVSTIAEEAGIGRRTVLRTLATLERRGYIERDQRPGLRSRYTVRPPIPSRSGTGAQPALVSERHRCQGDMGPVPERHRTGATVAPERTKERAKEQTGGSPASPDLIKAQLWPIYAEEMDAGRMRLHATRRKRLWALYNEQLREHDSPPALFRSILRAVKKSDHHMGTRAYQLPESLFRNPERRERWALAGLELLNGQQSDGRPSPMHATREELQSEREVDMKRREERERVMGSTR